MFHQHADQYVCVDLSTTAARKIDLAFFLPSYVPRIPDLTPRARQINTIMLLPVTLDTSLLGIISISSVPMLSIDRVSLVLQYNVPGEEHGRVRGCVVPVCVVIVT